MSITLEKRQTISLAKTSGAQLQAISLGLGWDAKPKGIFGALLGGSDIDLDASCILFDQNGNHLDMVWFQQLVSNCRNVKHSGDNRTGEGDGDDETIYVNLEKLSPKIESMVFTVNSFTGENFGKVKNAYCRILNGKSNKELARINLSDQGNHTGLIMAYLKRHDGDWHFTAVGAVCHGRSVNELIGQASLLVKP